MAGIDDDGRVRGETAAAPTTAPRRGRAGLAVLVGLCAGGVAAYGGAPLGVLVAILGFAIVSVFVGGGVLLFTRGQGVLGALLTLVGAGAVFYCVLSGVIFRAAEPYLAQSATLEPIAVADRLYLRHPEQGFLVGDPGPEWNVDNTLATALRLAFAVWGRVTGAWGWTDEVHGASITVIALHVDGTSATAENAGSFVRGCVGGLFPDPARSPHDDDDDDDESTFFVRDDTRHEAWARHEGMRGGGPIAASARIVLWDADGGGRDAVVVIAISHPDDDWTAFLSMVHAPHEPWIGPGPTPPGFTPAARTLTEARAAYAPRVTHDIALAGEPPPELAQGDAFVRTQFTSPHGPLYAYASVAQEPAADVGVMWLGSSATLVDTLTRGPMRLQQDGAAVVVPSLQGEPANPGHLDLYAGDVEDALAAFHDLASRTGLPPERIVVVGVLGGATLATLLAETGLHAGAFVAVSPADDVLEEAIQGPMLDGPIYEVRELEETWVRSPVHFLSGIDTPSFFVFTATAIAGSDASFRAEPGEHPSVTIFGTIAGDDATIATAAVELAIDAIRGGRPSAITAADLTARVTAPSAAP